MGWPDRKAKETKNNGKQESMVGNGEERKKNTLSEALDVVRQEVNCVFGWQGLVEDSQGGGVATGTGQGQEQASNTGST